MKKWEKVSGKNVILGVCSSIAVYKACQLASTLTKNGADVHVVMTESARKLISERIFQTLTRNPVCTDMWESIPDWKPEHISLAQRADIMVVAPATANAIGHFANGIADDFLSTVYLACAAPVLIAPAGLVAGASAFRISIRGVSAEGGRFSLDYHHLRSGFRQMHWHFV